MSKALLAAALALVMAACANSSGSVTANGSNRGAGGTASVGTGIKF
jgi:hypothetical protein